MDPGVLARGPVRPSESEAAMVDSLLTTPTPVLFKFRAEVRHSFITTAVREESQVTPQVLSQGVAVEEGGQQHSCPTLFEVV